MTTTYPAVMVTGHRPQHLSAEQQSFARAELDRLAVKVRDEHGAAEAISGMALGADTWWAQAALAAGLRLAAYIPFEEQPAKWRSADRDRWRELRAAAHREVVVGGGQDYDVRMLHARNDAMLREADLVIAVWSPSKTTGGTASAVRKARVLGLDLVVIDLDRLVTRIERPAPTEVTHITRFSGRYAFLSNFHTGEFALQGTTYASGEHAFNALKTTDTVEREHVRTAPTPAAAKRRGRRVTLRPGWDDDVRYRVMRAIVEAKFTDPDLRAALLATGDADLVEGNHWHDQHWGTCECPNHIGLPGLNHLGNMLMAERDRLAGAHVVTVGGDLLADHADVLVNPVNTVGVMGAGLAKAFARRWPAMVEPYRQACRDGVLRPGGAWLWRDESDPAAPWIACAATKEHWRAPSRLDWVRTAAEQVVLLSAGVGASSVAVPALGAGLGGLDWADVEPVLRAAFTPSGAEVRLYSPA